jgi:GT2 family glycosyltransferase
VSTGAGAAVPERCSAAAEPVRSPPAAPGPWLAGIVHHDAFEDLERCLASLRGQTAPPLVTAVVDTGADPSRLEGLARAHPEVRFHPRPNRGYGAGANFLLAGASEWAPDAAYVLILNPDVELEPDFACVLLREMEARPRVALASGKLLRPGGALIDSAGIRLPRHRRARDRGSEEPDRGQFDRAELVFGVSGAAMMIRRAALPDLALDEEVFDEDFFAYQDDTDLSWRANLLGWQVLYEPAARAVHGRRWRRERRSAIQPWIRRHSFKNHYLQIVKNERPTDLLRNLPVLAAWELLRLGYALVRDRAILPGYVEAARGVPRAWHKRRILQRRARARRAVGAPAS